MAGSAARGSDSGRAQMPDPLDSALVRQVLESAPSVVYVYDLRDRRTIFQNRRISILLGHTDTAVPPDIDEWAHLVHPEDVERYREHRARLRQIKPGESIAWDFRMRHADGGYRWYLTHDVLLSADQNGQPQLIVGSAADITDQRRAEETARLLVGEMMHRARNFATVVEVLGRQSLTPNEPESRAFLDRFIGRVRALLGAGELTLASVARDAPLKPLVETTLAPFLDPNQGQRIRFDGPHVQLSEATAGALALILHELATNALKYGALSDTEGTVDLNWTVRPAGDNQHLTLEWREHPTDKISEPTRAGFGTRLIRDILAREPGGKSELRFPPDGARCRIELDVVRTPAKS